MATLIGCHEVDDTDHWLSSPKRDEFFGALGVSVRTFVNPAAPTHVAVLLELPDSMTMDDLQAALQTPEAAAAEKYDGVRAETIEIFVER